MKNIIFWKNRITNNIEMMNSLLKDENLLIIIQTLAKKRQIKAKGKKGDILIGHMICEFIEQELFFDKKNV